MINQQAPVSSGILETALVASKCVIMPSRLASSNQAHLIIPIPYTTGQGKVGFLLYDANTQAFIKDNTATMTGYIYYLEIP